jgi:hypothetical protein
VRASRHVRVLQPHNLSVVNRSELRPAQTLPKHQNDVPPIRSLWTESVLTSSSQSTSRNHRTNGTESVSDRHQTPPRSQRSRHRPVRWTYRIAVPSPLRRYASYQFNPPNAKCLDAEPHRLKGDATRRSGPNRCLRLPPKPHPPTSHTPPLSFTPPPKTSEPRALTRGLR